MALIGWPEAPLFVNRQREFRTWHVPGLTPEIVYSVGLLDRLAREAAEAAETGGEECGGILFGTAEDGEVRVTAARPVSCEHAFGPHFRLSGNDEKVLRELVAGVGSDPDLRDLTPVGWYRSQTRSPIRLTEADVLLYDRYFPLPWQVSLVLQPRSGEPVRAGFFFRPARGPMQTASSYLEFEVASGAEVAIHREPGAAAAEEEPQFALLEQPPEAMLARPGRRMPSGRLIAMGVVAGIAAAAAAVGGFVWGRANATGADLPALALRLARADGRLYAVWNGAAAPVAAARSGSIEVRDGSASADFPLNASLLRGGSWPIANQSPDVSVRLTVEAPGMGEVTELARFLGPSPAPPTEPAPPPSPEAEALRSEVAALARELDDVRQANDEMERRAQGIAQQLAARAAAPPKLPEPTQRPPAVSPPPQSGPAPVTAAQAEQAKPQPPNPPAAGQTPPASSPAPMFPEGPPAAAVRQPPALPPPPPEPVRPAYSGPASGKTIWTGYLPAGGTISIDGRRASAGSVNAGLPPAPLRVAVFPAEFSSGGLSVFSGQARHASGNVVEPRSAQNGWLETRYLFNPNRARAVSVAEVPSQANGFKLTLRGSDKPVSVIVIEWQLAQQ
jgi:hypothetical protein